MQAERMNLYHCAACRRWVDAERAGAGRWIETPPLLGVGDALVLHLCPRCCDELAATGEAPAGGRARQWDVAGEGREEDEDHAG